MSSLEKEKDIAVEYIKKEREYMMLTNMIYFIELGEAVQLYNESIQNITNLRAELKKTKDLI